MNSRRTFGALVAAGLIGTALAADARAQTDYYNTDRGRPVQIEDAYPTERYGFELKVAPVRLERANGGVYAWGLDPEIAYGILPRTQIEIGLPLAYRELGAQHQSGIAGLEASVLHSFNAETATWPALALRADVLAPVGNLAPSRAYPSITGLATRTVRWARFHVNGQYTFGDAPSGDVGGGALEVSRWLAGGAVDRTFPLRAMLATAEFYGRGPMTSGEPVEYTAGAGLRYQLNPRLALDGGLGRRLNGHAPGWYLTFGSAYAFALPWLLPNGR